VPRKSDFVSCDWVNETRAHAQLTIHLCIKEHRFRIVCWTHGASVRDVKMLGCPGDGSWNHTISFGIRSSLVALFELAPLSLFSGAFYLHPVSIPVTRKLFLRIARSHSAFVAMCIPSITILDDGRRKRQVRGHPHHDPFCRPLSQDAYGFIPETPPASVVTARPSDPSRCPIPTDYSRFVDAYLAGQEKEKARARESEALKGPKPVKKEDVSKKGEAPRKATILLRENEKPHRRRRRSSASSASSRSWREMRKLFKEVLRQQGMDKEIRRQMEADRKRMDGDREQLMRNLERSRDGDLHSAHHKCRPRHWDRTSVGGDGGYFRTDTRHWSEA